MNLKNYISDNDMSVSELAKESGLPYTTVSEIVNGKKRLGRCSAETVYRISNSLGLTVERLLLSDGGSFDDRYALDRKQSLFLAKKHWDENVYCGMRMENRNVTFPQTRTILDNINVPEVRLDDITAIRNMRDAWMFIFKDVDARLDLDYICRLNSFIAHDEAIEWGSLRTGSVGISGTSYKPAVPVRDEVEKSLKKLLSQYRSHTETALDLFCFIAYRQLFWDGNKRTALAAANKLLVSKGCGMLTIGEKDMESFNEALGGLYETGDSSRLKEFLYRNALDGIDFS